MCEEQGGQIIAWDVCNNGIGYSIPGPAGGEPHCTYVDCCNWYQTVHVHDLGSVVPIADLIVEYTPGFYDGCEDIVTIDTSADDVSWTTIASFPTHSVDECPEDPTQQCWRHYIEKFHDVMNFQYVRITIPECYNDYSAACACVR